MAKNTPDSRVIREQGGRKKRRINRFRVIMLLFFLVVTITVVIGAVLLISTPNRPDGNKANDSLFGVKNIVVEGNSRYTDAQIIEAGGVFVGQSLFFVNKRRVAQNILQSFPYVEKVTVSNSSFSNVKITITEAQPVGIVSLESDWLIVSTSGKGLEIIKSSDRRVSDYRRIKCAIPDGGGVGKPALDSRSLEIVNAVAEAARSTILDNVVEIDITDFSNIKLNWKDLINIKLGGDSNLESKLNYACKTLSRVLNSHGEDAAGQIDLRMYSETSPKAVFTPADLLTTEPSSETDATGASTAAAS